MFDIYFFNASYMPLKDPTREFLRKQEGVIYYNIYMAYASSSTQYWNSGKKIL